MLTKHLFNSKPVSHTIIPIFVTSDPTHFTNHSCDKKKWPVYQSLENILSLERFMPAKKCCMMIEFLPVPPKHSFKGLSKTQSMTQQRTMSEKFYKESSS
jgi:hypothetical protein